MAKYTTIVEHQLEIVTSSCSDDEASGAESVTEATPRRSDRSTLTVLSLLLILALIILLVDIDLLLSRDLMTISVIAAMEQDSQSKSERDRGFMKPKKVYGLLHYAKTAGTTINGMLASQYRGVCGDKANSFDYYQVNEREKHSNKNGVTQLHGTDLVSQQYPGWNRGRVPIEVMVERGFEECDYVSLEVHRQAWNRSHPVPLELHVPCRDPIQHLLSACAFLGVNFDCNPTATNHSLWEQVQKCNLKKNRFGYDLESIPNLTLRCFAPSPVERYVAYMGQFLEPRRHNFTYAYRNSDGKRPRDVQHECLTQNPDLKAQVRALLIEKDEYYGFCDQCLGSERDLFRY